jgi:hypothetical protein
VTVRRLAGVAFSIGLVLVLLETTLRIAPGLVGGRLGNAVYSAYGKRGMYFQDREVHMNFRWPDFALRAYWNGYWWDHRTSARSTAGRRTTWVPSDLAARTRAQGSELGVVLPPERRASDARAPALAGCVRRSG